MSVKKIKTGRNDSPAMTQYTVNIAYLGDDMYEATIPGIKNLRVFGTTQLEALKKMESASKLWFETVEAELSGNIMLRVPKSLHKKLLDRSLKEKASLNQLITKDLLKIYA